MINYKIFGSETVDIVIEMGLGACIAEWEVLAGVEELWQEIMKDYLGYSKRSLWIHAKKGSHYIHLTEPEIIVESVNRIRHM